MNNKIQDDYLNQPRVKQFLRDGHISAQIRQIILSPHISTTIKDILIDNSCKENLINDFFITHIK